jgi:hypothetical protein
MIESMRWEVEITTEASLVSLSIWNSRCSDLSIINCQFSIN